MIGRPLSERIKVPLGNRVWVLSAERLERVQIRRNKDVALVIG